MGLSSIFPYDKGQTLNSQKNMGLISPHTNVSNEMGKGSSLGEYQMMSRVHNN
jgi:hypothetical protein